MLPMRRAVGHRQRCARPRRRTRRTCRRPSALRSISVTVSTRSVAVHAFAQRARQLDADDVRRQEVHRLAEHAGLGLDAADAPADDADAVDHRRVAVGADQRVGVVDAVLSRCTPRARYSRFTWCTMPMPGGTTLERVERLHAPLHELVALVVALELELHVQVERVRRRRSGRPAPSGRRRGRPAPAARSSSGPCPCAAATLRIAARSASSGTPVKSCSTTRATTNGISSVRAAFGFQLASCATCSSVTFLPSQLRSTDSSTMRMRDRQALDVREALRELRQRVEAADLLGRRPESLAGLGVGVRRGGFGKRVAAGRTCNLLVRQPRIVAQPRDALRRAPCTASRGRSPRCYSIAACGR